MFGAGLYFAEASSKSDALLQGKALREQARMELGLLRDHKFLLVPRVILESFSSEDEYCQPNEHNEPLGLGMARSERSKVRHQKLYLLTQLAYCMHLT